VEIFKSCVCCFFSKGVRQVCRWIFHAASGFCDHSLYHLLFSQVTRKAKVADETSNGNEDIWWILEGQDYPRLWWEAAEP